MSTFRRVGAEPSCHHVVRRTILEWRARLSATPSMAVLTTAPWSLSIRRVWSCPQGQLYRIVATCKTVILPLPPSVPLHWPPPPSPPHLSPAAPPQQSCPP